MMRILLTKWFVRFAQKNKLDRNVLAAAVGEMERGIVEADLGGGIFKKRIARHGSGKRAGYRTIVAYQRGRRAVFLYGFPKNSMDNVEPADLQRLKKLAAIYAVLSDEELSVAVTEGALIEVINEEKS